MLSWSTFAINSFLKRSASANVTFVLDATDVELDKRRRKREFRQSELELFVNLQREFMASLKRENIVFIDTTGLNASQVHENVVTALETYEII